MVQQEIHQLFSPYVPEGVEFATFGICATDGTNVQQGITATTNFVFNNPLLLTLLALQWVIEHYKIAKQNQKKKKKKRVLLVRVTK